MLTGAMHGPVTGGPLGYLELQFEIAEIAEGKTTMTGLATGAGG
jgi:hypothetical protein